MNLKALDQNSLLQKTKDLVTEERRITLFFIEHLREIERRLLFADLGYSSLFDFCVKHLGLSEGSAQRRISAMRLVRDLPDAKESLASGKLSLSNASKLHSVFRTARKHSPTGEKVDKPSILREVEGLTQKECEFKLHELFPSVMTELKQERVRIVSPESTELKLVIGRDLSEKLARLKELLSHQIPDGSLVKILDRLVTEKISELEIKKGLRTHETKQNSSTPSENPPTAAAVGTEIVCSDTLANTPSFLSSSLPNPARPFVLKLKNPRKAIPLTTQRAVWRKAQGKCEFENCGTRAFLEIDHRVPWSLGGGDALENLRLLCRTHNLS